MYINVLPFFAIFVIYDNYDIVTKEKKHVHRKTTGGIPPLVLIKTTRFLYGTIEYVTTRGLGKLRLSR